jgi:hypothetical protein
MNLRCRPGTGVGLAAAVLVLLLGGLPGLCDKDEPSKVSDLMKKKLKHSQKLLEALTTNDFTSLAKNGEELYALSKEVEWKVIKTGRYETYSDQFRSHCEDLVQHAKDKNLDGAALAYVQITLSCVKCHKYVREMRMTSLDDAPPRAR